MVCVCDQGQIRYNYLKLETHNYNSYVIVSYSDLFSKEHGYNLTNLVRAAKIFFNMFWCLGNIKCLFD